MVGVGVGDCWGTHKIQSPKLEYPIGPSCSTILFTPITSVLIPMYDIHLEIPSTSDKNIINGNISPEDGLVTDCVV